MNLVVDQGNTFCKLAIFDGEEIIFHKRLANKDLASIEGCLLDFTIGRAIISSVSDSSFLIAVLEKLGISALLLNKGCQFPIEIVYDTPDTLGIDRIVAAVGAWKLSPNTTNLIIDIGTAITYDIATAEEGFVGGNIAPGLDMRLMAMNHFTQNLPLLEREETQNHFGKNTNEAIRNGAQMGIQAEIEHYIRQAKTEYGEISTFLTGGDASSFEGTIKSGIFAVPNLVLLGLLEILIIN
jgi:type III pantothenate kinase